MAPMGATARARSADMGLTASSKGSTAPCTAPYPAATSGAHQSKVQEEVVVLWVCSVGEQLQTAEECRVAGMQKVR